MGKGNSVKILIIGVLMLFGSFCLASETTNVYIINNVSGGGYGTNYGSTMCTLNGGICTNGYYIMSSSRVRYSKPLWKRPTLREKHLAKNMQLAERYYY